MVLLTKGLAVVWGCGPRNLHVLEFASGSTGKTATSEEDRVVILVQVWVEILLQHFEIHGRERLRGKRLRNQTQLASNG